MPGNSVIGALRMVFGADFGTFEDGFKKADSTMAGFTNRFNLMAVGIATAAAGMAAGVAHSISGAFEDAADLLAVGEKLGIYVDELSKIKFVADQAGVAFQGMAEKIQNAMADASGMGGRTLKALGIDPAQTGGILETMQAVADKFAVMGDGAGKTKLAINLFGDEAEKLLPILDRGAEGLGKLYQKAEDLGYVFDQRTAAAGRRLKNALADITGVSDHMGGQILKRIPVLVEMAEKIADLTKGLGDGKTKWTLFTASMEAVIIVAKSAGSAFIVLAAQVGNLISMLVSGNKALGQSLTFDFAGARATLEAGIKDVSDRNAMMWDDINKIWKEGWNEATVTFKEGVGNWKTETAPVVKTFEEMKEAGKAALAEILGSPWEDFTSKMAAVKQALADGYITPVEEARMRMRLLTEEWRMQREESKAALEALTSDVWTSAADKMDAVTAAARRGTISFREMGAMAKQIADQQRQQWMDLGSTLSTFLTTAFDKSKTAAIAAAIINTAQGITKALAQGGIWGWAQAALIAATGAAQIAKIRSTNSNGGGGGAPSVSGGASAGGDDGAGAGGQFERTLFIQGINPSEWYGGEAVRALLAKMADMQHDGYQVVVK